MVVGAFCSFSTADTRPDGRAWPEPVQLVDGHWVPDGTGFAVADVAGQWHLYSASGGGVADPDPSPCSSPKVGALTLRRRPAWAAGPGRGALSSNARYDQVPTTSNPANKSSGMIALAVMANMVKGASSQFTCDWPKVGRR